MEINFENCSNYSGWVKKKASKVMVGWQKRFFRIIQGKVILYSEKEDDDNPKGQIMISAINQAVAIDKNQFQLTLGTKCFHLKTKEPEKRDEWVKVINFLVEYNAQNKKQKEGSKLEDEVPVEGSKGKSNKINSLDKGTLDLIRNAGFGASEDMKLNDKLIKSKGIDLIINVSKPEIKSRIYSGFLYKHHKTHDYFQKRWFFLISSRPLKDKLYEKDDMSLDPSRYQKDWIKFDKLFYFKYEKEKEPSGPIDGLDLSLSHKIETLDKDGKYYLILDVEDRVFEFYSEIKGDRDLWFEALKNSRRTAKEIKASVKGNPRNVQRLCNILEEGQNKLIDELEKEKLKTIGDYKEIQDFETLSFILKGFRKEIANTVDGCISNTPPKTELLTIYTENMTNTYLQIIQNFWANHYDNIEGADILKMSTFLFKFSDKLKKLKITEPNMVKNGKELVKIYMKKTYKNITDVIENILKSEREIKSITNENGELVTNGPNDLFDILSKSFNLIQETKIKYIHAKMLNMFYECIIQYLIGVDCITSNFNILVERDFLIAIANNSVLVNMLLNSLIDNFKDADVLGEKEINEEIRTKEIMSSLNLMSQNSVSRFVTDLSKPLAESFNCNYLLLDLRKILLVTHETYSELNPLMNGMIKKKCWEEVLKLTVFYYIKLLLTTAHKKVKKVEEITAKLEDDKGLLRETYCSLVGENLTNANLKILDDILDFMQISSYMIPSSCHTLREYLGPSFNISTVKALVKLRCDFSSDEKKEAINLCKEVLEKYTDKKKGGYSGFFEKMQNEIKIENEDSQEENGLQGVDEIDEEEKKKEEATKVMDIEEFLANNDGEEEEEEDEEDKKEEVEDKEEEQISDVVYEGKMKKKSYTVWQERFFQLKNGYLYWFKDKSSSTSQNKISIQNTMKVESHKDCKFLMVVEDKNDKKHGGKVYKFSASSNEEKEKWINAITNEMKRLKGEIEKKDDVLLVIKQKKKIIDDYYKLPDVGKERAAIKGRIINSIQKESFFKFKQDAYINSVSTNSDTHPNERKKEESLTNNEGAVNLMQEGTLQQFEIGFDEAKDSNVNSSMFSCCKECWIKFLSLFNTGNEPRNYKKEHLNPE